ncbi:hypothetical protein [Nocardioides mangrovi]|uniref:Lipoprotein n=1 Tax=Nocardioides mangrovi TaxID=2874580 RepID=A0ABS7UC28_9ACTN|nr:hypothetical protein [Nocardioides mangrovi]MBZ5738558.1 hypothetical protein [Nocardioides mangrovi]
MPLRQSARLLAATGALLLAAPVLTSCGFDYATDRDYTPGAGTNDRDALVDVLAAVVVSGQEGSGTFIASFANNKDDEEATVTGISGTVTKSPDDEGASTDLSFDSFSPITIPAGGLVNLADDDSGIVVTGDFAAGDFLDVTVTFGDGTSTDLEVPTYTNCGDYEGLDTSSDTPDPDQCTVETPDAETDH